VYIREPGLDHLGSAIRSIGTDFLHRNVIVSLLLSAISLNGILVGLARRRPLIAIALLHAIAVTLAVALPNRVFWIRNYLAVIPCLCLGFGLGVVEMAEKLRARQGVWGFASTAVFAVALAFALVALPLHDAISAERMHEDPRAAAIQWIATQATTQMIDVDLTSTVLGKRALGRHAELAEILKRPNVRFASTEIEACPPAEGGPEYVVDSSYRDTHKADPSDPYGPAWLFQSCPGYETVARFEPNPYEHSVRETPNWDGRVFVIVLRRDPRHEGPASP
jgi:hypothetical protein